MATETWFDFGDKELTYRVRDNSGDVEFDIEYSSIPAKRRSFFERNNWLRNVGLIWVVLGLLQIGLAITGERSLSGSGFWFAIGLGCLAFYRLTWSEYTIFDTDEGSIWILKNKLHNEIESKIDEERKRHLLAWYHGIDFSHDPEREIQTIESLRKRDALESSEAEKRIAELRATANELIEVHEEDPTSKKLH